MCWEPLICMDGMLSKISGLGEGDIMDAGSSKSKTQKQHHWHSIDTLE